MVMPCAIVGTEGLYAGGGSGAGLLLATAWLAADMQTTATLLTVPRVVARARATLMVLVSPSPSPAHPPTPLPHHLAYIAAMRV